MWLFERTSEERDPHQGFPFYHITQISYLPVPVPWTVYPHFHEADYELAFITRGHFSLNLPGCTIPLQAGSVVSIPPKTPHCFQCDDDRDSTHYAIRFTGPAERLTAWNDLLAPGPAYCAPFEKMSTVQRLLDIIQELAGEDFPVIRIMPNTPASVGEGMIQYCSSNVTAEEEEAFLRIMAPAGRLDAVPESLIDAASCVSGCGPAWVYQFIEALADGGVACGLPRTKAQEYAAQMVLGSAKLVLESGKHPGELKDAVCSPGGSTIQGVRVLEEHGLRGAVMDAVIASYNKTKEMGKG